MSETLQKTILIVDDEKLVSELCQIVLEDANYNTLIANDGLSALEIYKSKPVDLIILDLTLPKLSGKEVLSKIRTEDKTIKIIITSGLGDESIKHEISLLNINGILPKPFQPNELLKIVQASLYE